MNTVVYWCDSVFTCNNATQSSIVNIWLSISVAFCSQALMTGANASSHSAVSFPSSQPSGFVCVAISCRVDSNCSVIFFNFSLSNYISCHTVCRKNSTFDITCHIIQINTFITSKHFGIYIIVHFLRHCYLFFNCQIIRCELLSKVDIFDIRNNRICVSWYVSEFYSSVYN